MSVLPRGFESCRPCPRYGFVRGEYSVYYKRPRYGQPRPQPYIKEAAKYHSGPTNAPPNVLYKRIKYYSGTCVVVPPTLVCSTQVRTRNSSVAFSCLLRVCGYCRNTSANSFPYPPKMYFPSVIFILTLLGSVSLHLTEIDFNRIRQLPNDFSPTFNSNNRGSITHNLYRNKNYDDFKRYDIQSQKQTMENEVIQTHKPREDPRLFYQTDSYLREVQDHNHEVTYIYPGREVVNAEEEYSRPRRLRKMVKSLTLNSDDHSLCMQCPHDRTLIAKAGLDKVVLQSPRLFLCNGRSASREVRFVTMYGPNFGALLHQGSYVIVGKIMYNSQVLQMCKMQVHVILQSSRKCPLPNNLRAHCNNDYECSFTCLDPNLDLQGPRALVCGKDLNWEGNLPICKARKWCVPQEPPEHGRISCKGIAVENGPGLSEGSRCRVRCRLGWKAKNTVAICRRGSWNRELTCQPSQKITV